MNNILYKGLVCLAAATMVLGCNNSAKKAAKAEADAAAAQARQDSIAAASNKEKAAMELIAKLPSEPIFDIVTNMGTIKVKLYSKTPKHRENFAKLALTGYYDGLLFHRVINGFMIQAGDPYTRDTSAAAVAKYGEGGPNYTIPAEIIPEYEHLKGALAAARRGDIANPKKASSGSQFYLVQDMRACLHLNGQYTVFGQTIEGMDVIDRIASVATDGKGLPLQPVVIQTIKLDEKSTPVPDSSAKPADSKTGAAKK